MYVLQSSQQTQKGKYEWPDFMGDIANKEKR